MKVQIRLEDPHYLSTTTVVNLKLGTGTNTSLNGLKETDGKSTRARFRISHSQHIHSNAPGPHLSYHSKTYRRVRVYEWTDRKHVSSQQLLSICELRGTQ